MTILSTILSTNTASNKVVLTALVAFIGLAIVCGWVSSPSVPTPTPAQTQYNATHPLIAPAVAPAPQPPVQSLADARRSAALDKLDAIVVHCPSFFDAPLGNKPCPQQEAIDYAKSVVRMSAD